MILHITDDFDPDRIADSGQCFRWEKMPNGSFRILSRADCLYLQDLGGNCFAFSCTEEEFASTWREYFDLDENYSAVRARINPEKDPFLCSAAEQEEGIRILRQDAWEMLITFIISQNKNIPAIRRSVELLCEICGEGKSDFYGYGYYAFPTPEAIAALSEEELKSCRLGYRWNYVQSAAATVLSGSLNLEALKDADEETTIRSLTELRGVGIKVASCVSLFGLHHINAFPQDVWIKRVLANEYPHGYPFEEYAPYNGIYQQYMFAAYRKR